MVVIAVLKILDIIMLQIILVIILLFLVPVVYKGLPIIQDNHVPNQGDYIYDNKINLVHYLGAQNLHDLNHLGDRLAHPHRPVPSCVQRIAIREQDQSIQILVIIMFQI